MTVFTKWILSWAGLVVGGIIAGTLAMGVSQYFLLLFFVNLLVWDFVIRRIECRSCGTPIHWTVDDFNDRDRMIRVPVEILKRKCHVCGCDLMKN